MIRVQAFLSLVLLVGTACAGPTTAGTADTLAARVPPVGSASTLDIGTWNIEWFGDTGNGPADEARQLATVRSLIKGMGLDLLGIQEVVSAASFDSLRRTLPGYDGVLANDPGVTGGAAAYARAEQKVGLLYRTSMATLVSSRIVLGHTPTDFGGRPPLECTFRVSLSGSTLDLVVLVLHMKALADLDSWQRRVNAADSLRAYLDRTYPTQQVIVVGDWNDDLDESISERRQTPYAAFLIDVPKYAFPTVTLTVSRVPTVIGFTETIDHHLVTNELMSRYVAASARVVRLDQIVANYAHVTSDHLPVVTSYR